MMNASDEAGRAALAEDEVEGVEEGRTLANLKDRLRSRRLVGSTRRHEGEPRAKAAPTLRAAPLDDEAPPAGALPPGEELAATSAPPPSPPLMEALTKAPPPLPEVAAARGPTTAPVSRAELRARELGTVELEAPSADAAPGEDEVASFRRRRRLLGWAIAVVVLVAAVIIAAIVLFGGRAEAPTPPARQPTSGAEIQSPPASSPEAPERKRSIARSEMVASPSVAEPERPV